MDRSNYTFASRIVDGFSYSFRVSGQDGLFGDQGDDYIVGAGEDDRIDGGSGMDTAAYGGQSYDYAISTTSGTTTVRDIFGADGQEGTDTVTTVEVLAFQDQSILLAGADNFTSLAVATRNILRVDPNTGAAASRISQLNANFSSGQITKQQAISTLVSDADGTTSVAVLNYEFFTGSTPSAAGLDYLVSPSGGNPNNLNSAYYQSFSTENRYINFAVNIGKLGDGYSFFSSTYGTLSLEAATQKAYEEIFGNAPSSSKISDILTNDRVNYFNSYGQDGRDGLGTKAAMVGWLLAEAEKANLGQYAKSNSAYLTDLADGAGFAIDLIGTYGNPAYDYGA